MDMLVCVRAGMKGDKPGFKAMVGIWRTDGRWGRKARDGLYGWGESMNDGMERRRATN